MTSVDREHCLALVYDRRWQGSRIGAVWLGARHAVQELARVLNVPPQLAAPQALALPQVANGVPGIEP